MNAAKNNHPVMILAGGTGGHIFPGLAVAAALRERGVPVRWLGADGGMETKLVPQHGIALDTIAIKGLRGKGLAALLRAPLKLFSAVRAARELIDRHEPRAVVSFGGYASGPGGLAARMARVPLLVHEQNRAPGMTNRVLARLTSHIYTGFPDTFATRKETVLGNPVRAEIAAVPAPAERFAQREGAMRVLVLGGSQGARALNSAVPQALAKLPAGAVQVRHQCGEKLLAEARASYDKAGVQVQLEPFIADMAEAYAWADVVLCRAGALTLAELCAAGVGSVLVPFPQAVDDHQTRNAEYLLKRGAARLHKQSDQLAEQLATDLTELLQAPQTRLAMAEAARSIALPQAAADMAEAIIAAATAHTTQRQGRPS